MHALACLPVAAFGTPEQRERWLPPLLAGELIAGYSLSEPQAGSDAAALRCKAEHTDDGYRITGTKAWITHGGKADLYALFARTGDGQRRRLLLPRAGPTPTGCRSASRRRRWACTRSPRRPRTGTAC